MNATTLRKLGCFVGQVCSIVTTSMNRDFDERIAREHFVVRVEEVNADGLWGSHPYCPDMLSFFAMAHVISIHTETELDPNNPEHAAMIAEFERKTGQKAKPDVGLTPPKPAAELPILAERPVEPAPDDGSSLFVDIASLERLADDTRRTFAAYESLAEHQAAERRSR